jgi:hypothetical protein
VRDAQFNAFSPIRIFSDRERRKPVDLFVAGYRNAGAPTGFGVVFSDVDQLGSASIKLLGVNGNSLGVPRATCPDFRSSPSVPDAACGGHRLSLTRTAWP